VCLPYITQLLCCICNYIGAFPFQIVTKYVTCHFYIHSKVDFLVLSYSFVPQRFIYESVLQAAHLQSANTCWSASSLCQTPEQVYIIINKHANQDLKFPTACAYVQIWMGMQRLGGISLQDNSKLYPRFNSRPSTLLLTACLETRPIQISVTTCSLSFDLLLRLLRCPVRGTW